MFGDSSVRNGNNYPRATIAGQLGIFPQCFTASSPAQVIATTYRTHAESVRSLVYAVRNASRVVGYAPMPIAAPLAAPTAPLVLYNSICAPEIFASV
jgi:hypothetical protein